MKGLCQNIVPFLVPNQIERRHLMSKLKVALILSLVIGLLVVSGSNLLAASAGGNPGPKVVVTPSAAPLSSKAQVVLMGSGFQPGQEINLVVHAKGQLRTNINDLVDTLPVPDEGGAWVTGWTLGRYTRFVSKMGEEGMYTLEVTDADYNVLTTAPFGLVDTTKPPEDWPDWARALLSE